MTLRYTYFEEDGGYVGFFNDFPQHLTEGNTIEELEMMLVDLYACLHFAEYQTRPLRI
jgi:predicted RNase H-like HicB family nuclease